MKFTEFTKKQNIKSYVFILPYEFQTRDCKLEVLLPQTKIKKIAEKIDNNIYDLTSDFCRYKNPKKLYLKYDPMHLSEKGHEFVYSLTNDIINQ